MCVSVIYRTLYALFKFQDTVLNLPLDNQYTSLNMFFLVFVQG